jgi:acyl transferase domain-containing protein
MFPGQGSQYVNMGVVLYGGEAVFRDAVDRCATALKPHLGCDLREFLFPDAADVQRAKESLNNTFYTQPAIFTISYALATVLMHWGIRPGAFIGHSIGEFVAATLGAVMDLDEALRLVATRGRLMQALPTGGMLSIRLPAEDVEDRLPQGVDLAAVNGPQLCVVAGPVDELRVFAAELEAEGAVCRMLHTSHAFHSSMMDPVVEPFLRTVETVHLSPARIPFVSTVTGDWIKPDEVTDPSYWARHLRSPVRFSQAVKVLLDDAQQTLVECGPRRTCTTLALQHRPSNPSRITASMPDSAEPMDEYPSLLLALGALWLNGCDVNWKAYHEAETRRRVPFPAYPFQRKRYWIDPGDTAAFGLTADTQTARAATVSARSLGEEEAPETFERDGVTRALVAVLEETLGAEFEAFDEDARFLTLGLDSLLLTQLARILRVRFDLEVTFRQLTEVYATPRLLADAIRASRRGTHEDEAGASVAASRGASARASGAAPGQTLEGARTAPAEAPPLSVAGARLGRDAHGRPAWFVPDPSRPGKYVKVENHD